MLTCKCQWTLTPHRTPPHPFFKSAIPGLQVLVSLNIPPHPTPSHWQFSVYYLCHPWLASANERWHPNPPHPTPCSMCMCASPCVPSLVCKCQWAVTAHPTPLAPHPILVCIEKGFDSQVINYPGRKCFCAYKSFGFCIWNKLHIITITIIIAICVNNNYKINQWQWYTYVYLYICVCKRHMIAIIWLLPFQICILLLFSFIIIYSQPLIYNVHIYIYLFFVMFLIFFSTYSYICNTYIYIYIYIYLQKGTLSGPHFPRFWKCSVFSTSCSIIYVHIPVMVLLEIQTDCQTSSEVAK